MKFPPEFLDDIRARLPVSKVVGAVVDLRKAGVEWEGLSPFNKEKTPSLKCNDQKRIWKDFSSGKGGDIFDFIKETQGCSFVEAVERLARDAGVASGGDRSHRQGNGAAGPSTTAAASQKGGKRQIVATYDYTDGQGSILYQVVRYEPKGFSQRRPHPSEKDRWVWGLDAGEYMRKGPGADWFRYDADRFAGWGYKERAQIGHGVEHGLYNIPVLREALGAGETIFIVEGERDCESLAAWDLPATTNSGGAKHWSDRHAAMFRDADVVIPIDNDDPGRDRGHLIAASLRGIARRTRLLDISQHWTACPDKGDITDWKDAGGKLEQLLEIIERLPDWKPEPPKSSFGALRFVDLDLPGREHEWIVKGIIPRGGVGMVIGKWQSGKSFFATDLGLTVAQGGTFMGRKVRRGLVIYQAGEAGLGLRQRLRAARTARGLGPAENLPFVLMPQPLDMYSNNDPVNRFIEEARRWAAYYEMPIELIVIDTFSAATPGANENSSEHVSLILERGNRIAREIGGHVLWVHHLNAAGEKARGHSSLMGNVDTVIEISELEQVEREKTPDGQEILRNVREARIIKQKESERGTRWKFVLKKVEVGRDEDGDPVTTCIVTSAGEIQGEQVATDAKRQGVGIFLTDERIGLFKALLGALDDTGVVPPAELKLPISVVRAVQYGHFRFAYRKRVAPTDEDAKKHAETVKKRLQRFNEFVTARGICGVEVIGDVTWIWPTGKPVYGRGFAWPAPRQKAVPAPDSAPLVDPATGEDIKPEDWL